MPLLFGRQPSAANRNQFMAAGFNDADLLDTGLGGGFNHTIPRQHHAVLVDDDRPACTDTMQRIDNHPDVARIVRAAVVRVRQQVAHVRRCGAGFGRRDTMIQTVNLRFDFWQQPAHGTLENARKNRGLRTGSDIDSRQ